MPKSPKAKKSPTEARFLKSPKAVKSIKALKFPKDIARNPKSHQDHARSQSHGTSEHIVKKANKSPRAKSKSSKAAKSPRHKSKSPKAAKSP